MKNNSPKLLKKSKMKKLVLIKLIITGIGFICATLPVLAIAETVYVKYRGSVDLAPFKCEWISRSSVVNRLCYDSREQYVIVNLTGTYYHYCEVPAGVVENWRNADSMGRYYNAQVKGHYDCRILHVPSYNK